MSAENYVYKKEVDWSLFNYGLNIPIEHQVKFKQIAGRFIERGESKPITLYLNGSSYKARLYNMQNMETMQTWFRSAIPAIAILRMRFEDASVAVSIIRNIVKQSVTV